MSRTLVIAEKPSVARDIAQAVGASSRGRGSIEGPSHVVTWCVGHLVELKAPADYDPAWGRWDLASLPIAPEPFGLKPVGRTLDQYELVARMLHDASFGAVVNACDAGREGELIFRYVYELSGSRLPILRLWISSMTPEAIREGMGRLEPGARYDALYEAARARSQADWLVGLNATRALTIKVRQANPHLKGALSVGRVQTPTLALIARRHAERAAFRPEDYWEIEGRFETEARSPYRGSLEGEGHKARRFASHAEARAALSSLAGLPARIASCERKEGQRRPPQAFDLTTLQREANTRLGLSAQATLEAAQSLYETHKVASYPRTDSRYITPDLAARMPEYLEGLASFGPVAGAWARFSFDPARMDGRLVDASKVSDHHAILPTGRPADARRMSEAERDVFELIARRTLAVLSPAARVATTVARTEVGPAVFVTRGTQVLDPGWMEFERPGEDESKKAEAGEGPIPADLAAGQVARVDSVDAKKKRTKAPPRLTEASLLRAMETAGRSLDDDELERAMGEAGLGTPATRAATIEKLLRRKYVERSGKHLEPTALGVGLIEALGAHERLTSAELTARWELGLERVARGEADPRAFMRGVTDYARELTEHIKREGAQGVRVEGPEPIAECPACTGRVFFAEKKGAFCEGFRAKPRACGFYLGAVIAKKALTKNQMAALIRDKETKTLKGFSTRDGAKFERALVLTLDEASGRWRAAFPRRKAEPSEPARALGAPCPACSATVLVDARAASCSGCGLKVWREIAKKALGDAQIEALLRKEVVGPIAGFTSRKGAPFSASLRLVPGEDRKGKVEFVFDR